MLVYKKMQHMKTFKLYKTELFLKRIKISLYCINVNLTIGKNEWEMRVNNTSSRLRRNLNKCCQIVANRYRSFFKKGY